MFSASIAALSDDCIQFRSRSCGEIGFADLCPALFGGEWEHPGSALPIEAACEVLVVRRENGLLRLEHLAHAEQALSAVVECVRGIALTSM